MAQAIAFRSQTKTVILLPFSQVVLIAVNIY